MQAPNKSQEQQKKAVEVLDPEFEEAIASYIDTVIEEEKDKFQPGIESFQVHANRIKEEVRNSMVQFQQNFKKGSEVVFGWLDANKIAKPVVAEANVEALKSTDEFLKQVNEGKYLYEILGFSEDTLKTFYKAAYTLSQEKEYAKARDAFFFLVTIAPFVADFWIGLSVVTTQLKEYDTALQATLRAIELQPQDLLSYLNAVHIYLQMNERDMARELCKKGLEVAKHAVNEPWAKDFTLALEEAISLVNRGG